MTALRTVLLLLLFLSHAGSAVAATLRVPDDHATLQEAIDAVEAGDVLRIGPGEFAGFSASNLTSIRIVGESGHQIVGDITLSNSDFIEMKKLRVDGSIVVTNSSNVTLRRGRIKGGGVEMTATVGGTVERTRVVDAVVGILMDGGDAELTRNLVKRSDDIGIQVSGGGRLEGNKVEGGAASAGIAVSGDVTIRVIRNQIVEVEGPGIDVGGSQHRVKRNEVLGAGEAGVESDGIRCEGDGSNQFIGNLIKRSHDGIDLKGNCAANRVIGNTLKKLRSDGMDVETASNLVSGNVINGAAAVGIEVEGSNNTVEGNRIKSTGEQEIIDAGEGNAISDNICPDNPTCQD